MVKIYPIIPTYQREESLKRCIKSLKHIPSELLGDVTIVNDIDILPCEARCRGTERIGFKMSNDDVFLFLDDDIELLKCFEDNIYNVLELVCAETTGCVHLMTKPGKPASRTNLGYIGGGILLQKEKYDDFGGFGNDFVDDVELFLRSYIAGYKNYRDGRIWSIHNLGTSGGLRAKLGIKTKTFSHLHYTELDKTYPDWIEKSDKHWIGFRLIK